MDAVLGLSVTPSAVGLVLVEGQDADGATMDRDAFDVGSSRSRGRSSPLKTSEQAAAAVLRSEAIAATRGHRLHSIGVTWSDDADAEASLLLKSLSDSGFDNVVPVRMPEATEALARGIADVIGYHTTAVCVIEPETVIVLIVHSRDRAVQTAMNHTIVTEEDLIRWLSRVFTRADWQPEALVVVGSGGDDEIMPILEDALSVPVFAPAEAQLALARGAALASAQSSESVFTEEADDWEDRRKNSRRRAPLSQSGPLVLLVAGVLTFVTSVSVAVSLQLAPKREAPAAEPRPAAKTTSETPAAATQIPSVLAPPAATPRVPVTEAPPPVVAPPPVYSEPPGGLPEAPVSDSAAPSVDGVPAEPPAAPPPVLPPPLPDQAVPPVAPAPVERPGILSRIRDKLHGGREDEVQQAPELAPPPPADAPAPPSDAPPLLPPP
ncbi:DUF7159 family protein [Mycobacterium sp. MMS18-G62]